MKVPLLMRTTQLLDEQPGSVRGAESGRPLRPSTLRRVTLKLVVNHGLLPRSFYLKGVLCNNQESQGAGFFADIYLGDWEGKPVALKRLRVVTQPNQQDQSRRMVRAELRFIEPLDGYASVRSFVENPSCGAN